MKSLPICLIAMLLGVAVTAAHLAGDEKPTDKAVEKPAGKVADKPVEKAAAEPKPAARAVPLALPALRVRAARPADQIEAMAQQYEQYMHPKMWRELEFIRQHCDLTPKQRPEIKAAGLASAKEAAKEFARGQQQSSRGDLGIFVRREMFKALEKTLTPDQMAQYQQAAVRRAASVQKAVVRSTVARLDALLYLSSEQRNKIAESLTTNWQEDWEVWLAVANYGGLYLPMIPDEQLNPHLTAQQLTVWKGARKVSPNSLSGARQRQQADDEWWDGKEETENAKPEVDEDTKPAAKELDEP